MRRQRVVAIAFGGVLFSAISVSAAPSAGPTAGPNTHSNIHLNTEKLPESEYRSYQKCGLDTDCVVVQNGCCDCANGGEDIAINKLYLDKFKARFSCEQIMCTMMAAVPPCGSGLVSCVSNSCHYEAKRP